MRGINVVLLVIVGGSLVAGTVWAQDTNAPLTKIEIFEARTGTVIVRGSVLIGSMSAQTGTVSVRAKESVEAGSGRKEYGIAVGMQEGGRPEDATVIDYDELDSFLNGIDYIRKANPSMTSLALAKIWPGLYALMVNDCISSLDQLPEIVDCRIVLTDLLVLTESG